ncbi:CRISPR-associated helicase/endonuclease Cas3 [Compostimonas suwonensis]|uniref:CRISPR-associated endonuclease/helicase Cas3 n=1 Tax=Compostimonas suwonensis TaxID=1048394 RepID=A0A2M9C3S3_9MICO|nr:CRISPR-associated helicase/endonuclease Cas3 [Compostimonas suwonensis]PJJ65181.1 CRISPR-associated endonuclease/helicase Cas3 [Compostimonas suwonensis]
MQGIHKRKGEFQRDLKGGYLIFSTVHTLASDLRSTRHAHHSNCRSRTTHTFLGPRQQSKTQIRGVTIVALSTVARTPWAKSSEDETSWLPLHVHMADSAAVADILWDEWIPRSVRELLSRDLNDDLEFTRRVFVFLAAQHDCGKCTPAFAVQVESLTGRMRDAGLRFRIGANSTERSRLPHSAASFHLLTHWLTENQHWSKPVAQSYAAVVGSHHGVTPTSEQARVVGQLPELVGEGELWKNTQHELIDYAARLALHDGDLGAMANRPLSPRSQVLLTGLVIVADWIASDETRFSYDFTGLNSTERARRALGDLRLTPPWQPGETRDDVEGTFRERFGLGNKATLRPVQRAASELARTLPHPGLMIIESEMGSGKTEAALLATEILATRFGQGGCFVALPTMATSDAMFSRVRRWVEHLPVDPDAIDVRRSMYLAHGKASLNEETLDLLANFRAVGDHQGKGESAEEWLIIHEWLNGRKKGPLANFVVGTIDQVLFAGLKSRHLMLRHLALANKVVVIDEVHSYDAYMNVYLERVLEWLGHYEVPVIMLSATLPTGVRKKLLRAYAGERRPSAHPKPDNETSEEKAERKQRLRAAFKAGVVEETDPFAALDDIRSYPLITAVSDGELFITPVEAPGESRQVELIRAADDDETLLRILDESLADGGCAVIVRNTVARAQDTMRLVKEHLGSDTIVKLAHSRFAANDRVEIDTWLRTTFGSPDSPGRPPKAIVVGTQVLEQSLDIDFDVMVTDLAPTDLLLQRIGRLHRHERGGRPSAVAEARCHIVGVEDWSTTPPTIGSSTSTIYSDYPLLRTLMALDSIVGSNRLSLPRDIPALVRATYDVVRDAPPGWDEPLEIARRTWDAEIESKHLRAQTFLLGSPGRDGSSLVGWIDRGVGEVDGDSPEGQAQVRDTEDTLEVLLVQRVGSDIRTLPTLAHGGGLVIKTMWPPDDSRVERTVANSSVRLPPSLTAPWRFNRVLGALEENAFEGWQKSYWLRGQLALVLDENMHAELAGADVRYDKELGLIVTIIKKGDSNG